MATIPSVAATELIRTSWGNLVASELNTRTVKTDASMPITGSLIITGAPSLKLRRSGDTPYLQFESSNGATRFAYIQGQLASLLYSADSAAAMHRFLVGAAEVLRIDSGGIVLQPGKSVEAGTGNISTAGQLRGMQARLGNVGSTPQLVIADTNGGGAAAGIANVSFYHSAASLDSLGARSAYVGYAGEGFQVQAGASCVVQAAGGDLSFEASGAINFLPGNTLRFLIESTTFLAGKAASNLADDGVELYGIGSGAIGSMRSTTSLASLQNIYARHIGAADANGQAFAQFTHGSGAAALIGSITQNGSSGVAFNETSDYRLKNDLGPIADGIERLMLLRPRRITWKADPGAGQQDAFLAHEVSPAAPWAVTGAKDAVMPESDDPAASPAGAIDPQQLDTGKLIPLIVAALQEAVGRIEDLEGAA